MFFGTKENRFTLLCAFVIKDHWKVSGNGNKTQQTSLIAAPVRSPHWEAVTTTRCILSSSWEHSFFKLPNWYKEKVPCCVWLCKTFVLNVPQIQLERRMFYCCSREIYPKQASQVTQKSWTMECSPCKKCLIEKEQPSGLGIIHSLSSLTHREEISSGPP